MGRDRRAARDLARESAHLFAVDAARLALPFARPEHRELLSACLDVAAAAALDGGEYDAARQHATAAALSVAPAWAGAMMDAVTRAPSTPGTAPGVTRADEAALAVAWATKPDAPARSTTHCALAASLPSRQTFRTAALALTAPRDRRSFQPSSPMRRALTMLLRYYLDGAQGPLIDAAVVAHLKATSILYQR